MNAWAAPGPALADRRALSTTHHHRSLAGRPVGGRRRLPPSCRVSYYPPPLLLKNAAFLSASALNDLTTLLLCCLQTDKNRTAYRTEPNRTAGRCAQQQPGTTAPIPARHSSLFCLLLQHGWVAALPASRQPPYVVGCMSHPFQPVLLRTSRGPPARKARGRADRALRQPPSPLLPPPCCWSLLSSRQRSRCGAGVRRSRSRRRRALRVRRDSGKCPRKKGDHQHTAAGRRSCSFEIAHSIFAR